jgi:hypothetical protein
VYHRERSRSRGQRVASVTPCLCPFLSSRQMADPSVPPLTPTSAHGEREGRTLTVSSDASSSTMSTVPRSRSATPARRAISEVIAEPLPSFDYAQIQDEFIEDDKDYDVALRGLIFVWQVTAHG